ncbi:hypothetical protein ACF06P_39615 [Streptomyces sp. NPDC015684]|uniref:AMP-binding enzyme n=1 Tax=Streptomyces sp. NPDC015684 TaxID=3364963 RepID=UPI0036FE71FD
MKGYWRRPEATAETIADGWLRTADIGVRDPDALFRVVDRKKDLIIRGGFNVYPREVEEVLHEHSAVAEAAVVGVPHPTHGEEIAALVTLRSGAASPPRRAARLRPRPGRPVQVPASRPDRRQPAQGGDRQDPQKRDHGVGRPCRRARLIRPACALPALTAPPHEAVRTDGSPLHTTECAP